MNSDGSIILETNVDTSGINLGFSKIKSGIGTVVKTFAAVGAAATAAFTAISKSSVDSYAEYEQLTGGVETLFKTSSDAVMEYARQSYQTAGMSANAYMNTVTSFSASLLQSLGNDTAKAAEYGNQAVIDMADNANKMGTDIQRIQDAYQGFAKQNFTMLDNLKLGYGGTKTEMERLLKKAEEIKAANGEMANYSIDSFADITEAIHVVQTEMGITGTTAKEAASTIQGSMNMAKAAWENLLTGMADENADVEDLMNKFSDSVVTAFENLMPVVEKTLDNLPALVTKLGKKLIDAVPAVFNKIAPKVLGSVKELITAIITTISTNSQTIGSTIANMVGTIAETFVALIPRMLEAGAQIIMGIVQGMQSQYPALTTAITTISAIFGMLKAVELVQGIVTAFNSINTALQAYTAACATSQSVSVLLASTMTPLQLAVGVLTGQVSIATVAQTLWNTVMSLNPAVLIVTALVGLTTAVVGVVSAYDSYIEQNSEVVQATKVMADAAKEAADKAQEQSDKIAKLSETAPQTIEDAEAEAYVNRTLADELYDLAEQTDLTAEQKDRMRLIVDELNESVSGLNLQLDDETGKLNMTEEALDDYISKSLEMAKVKAMQDLYTESLKEQYKTQAEAVGNAKKLAEAQDQLNEIMSQTTTQMLGYGGIQHEVVVYSSNEQKEAVNNCKEAIRQYSAALEANQDTIKQSANNIENLSDATGVDLPASWDTAKTSTEGFFDALLQQTGQAAQGSVYKGNDYGDGFSKGIDEKQAQAYKSGWDLAMKALQGTQDAQNSHSPAKETEYLGEDFDDGYTLGINQKADEAEKAGENLAQKALQGAVKGTEKAKKYISTSLSQLIDDSRSEEQKLKDSWYDDEFGKLASEKLYESERVRIEAEREKKAWDEKEKNAKEAYEEEKKSALERLNERKKEAKKNSEVVKAEAEYEKSIKTATANYEQKLQEILNDKLEQEREEAENNYLQTLEDNSKKERQLYEARLKDIENLKRGIIDAYNEMAESAISDIENLQKIQNSFAKKLSEYGSVLETKSFRNSRGEHTYTTLTDIGKQTQTLEKYYAELMKVKKRENVPQEFFETLRDMSVDEGLDYATKLTNLTDKEFDEYIAEWKRKQDVSAQISKELYKDEADKLAEEVKQKFDVVEEEFFGVGETAADNFESGFMDELKNVVKNIKNTILSEFSTVLPTSISPELGVRAQNVPALARGAVLPGGRPFMAIVNDNPAGDPNVEAPAKLIKQMAIEAYQEMGLTSGQSQQVIKEERYYLDKTELMRIVYDLAKGGERLNGKSLIDGGAY